MKIQPNQILTFLNKIPDNIKIILFYGPDSGLITHRLQIAMKSFLGDDFDLSSLVYLYESDLKDYPEKLEEEFTTFSLFSEEKKIIILRDIKDFSIKLVNSAIDSISDKILVLIESDDLSTTSSLRKTAENSEKWASVACYQDNNLAIKDLIKKKILVNSCKIDDDAMNFLIENLGNNRLISESEIDKLILYKYYDKHITLQDVLENIDNQSVVAFDRFIYAFFDKNIEEAYINLKKLLEEENVITIVRVLLNHTIKLHYAKLQIEDGIEIDIVIKNIKPPIFFLYIDKFKGHIKFSNIEYLKNIIDNLISIEILCKNNATIGELSFKNFVLYNKLI